MVKNDFPDPKLYSAVARLMDHNCSDVKHTNLSQVAAKPAIFYSTQHSQNCSVAKADDFNCFDMLSNPSLIHDVYQMPICLKPFITFFHLRIL